MSDTRERRAPPDIPEPDSPASRTPVTPDVEEDEEDITVRLSKTALKEAVIDALRLDYEGRLAKICEQAIEDNGPRLREFVESIISGVVEDEGFAENLRTMVRKRIYDRLFAKVDVHVKRTPAAHLSQLLEPDPE